MTPTEMALAFVTTRPFVTSNIIGATSLQQLAENIQTHSRVLPESVLSEIEAIHQRQPNPAP